VDIHLGVYPRTGATLAKTRKCEEGGVNTGCTSNINDSNKNALHNDCGAFLFSSNTRALHLPGALAVRYNHIKEWHAQGVLMRRLWLFLILCLLLTVVVSIKAQESITITTLTDTTLHAEPDFATPIIEVIVAQTPLDVSGRNETGHWVWVEARGWLPTGHATLPEGASLLDLPVVDTTLDTPEQAVFLDIEPAMENFTDDEVLLNSIQRLRETPILYNMSTDTVREIFERGQTTHIRADVFTKIGDSNTSSGDYLRPVGMADGVYCTLGAYTYLQATIDHFSTSPREGVPNSFDTVGFAARDGLSMAGVLDPFWATAPDCLGGESPLLCDYRMNSPAIALIMLGRGDVVYDDPDLYRTSTIAMVEASIQEGVIPVLTTFVLLPDDPYWAGTLTYDNILIDIAKDYEIPLINLWLAVQTLPQYGIGPDLSHLAHAVGEFCNFTGAEMVYGGTLRNLLSLQALDEIRRQVMGMGE
jgi:hypothetical protein